MMKHKQVKAKSFNDSDVFKQIIVNGTLDTYEKRKTVMKKTLMLIKDRELYLGQNNAGDECFITYNSPIDLLKRSFQDVTIDKSFKTFTKEFHEGKFSDGH